MLTDLGDIVVRRVRSVEPSFAPQRLYSGEWSDFIHKVARELVDRSLLIQSNAYKPFEFGLRFPHHLLTLLGEDPSQHIRDALGRIGAAPTNPPTWVLTEEMLDNLRWLLEEGSKIGVIGTAIPTHWSTPVLDADAGLAARLSGRGSAVQVITATAEVSDYKGAAFALFVGGTSLTRAALARETEFFDVEVQRTGRMSQEQIAVWFQRRRATEFTGLNALSRLMAETGGLPLLVGALDVAILKMETAPSLGDAELNELLMALERQRGDLAASLYPGAGDDALSEEELALLRLVVRASDDFGQEDFAAAIEARLIDGADVAFGPTATLSVHLLVVLGLLPREVGPSNRAFRDIAGWVGPNDVIRRILAHLPT
jgi:hypothetical protein